MQCVRFVEKLNKFPSKVMRYRYIVFGKNYIIHARQLKGKHTFKTVIISAQNATIICVYKLYFIAV